MNINLIEIGHINIIEKIIALLNLQGITVSESRKQELEEMSKYDLAWGIKIGKGGYLI